MTEDFRLEIKAPKVGTKPISRYITSSCIGYQKGLHGDIVASVDKNFVEFSDGSSGTVYQIYPVNGAFPINYFLECPDIDIPVRKPDGQ